MSIELTTGNIGMSEIFYDNYIEQAVDCDITLPDYCPDIMRIIKCTVSNSITNSKLIGDRATADGNAKVRIIYADEKNNICCYDYDYSFSKYAELGSAFDNACLTCTAKTEYVNCRAVNKRRADVHGVVSIRFNVAGSKSSKLISDANGEGVQLKRKGIDIEDVVAVATKNFEISQVENVGDVNGGIGKVIDVYVSPILNECKIIKGKILLKGEFAVRVTYCSDSAENEACVLCCNIPFNEIVEASTVTDECKIDAKMHVTRVSAEPKTDNDGEYRYMNINAEITAKITAYAKRSISVVADAYSTDTEIETKYTQMEFLQLCSSINENFVCKQSLDVSSMAPKKIYAFTLSEPECRYRADKEKVTVSGKVPVNLIVIDSEGVPVLCEREAEFEYSRSVDDAKDIFCTPQVSVGGCSATLSGDGKVDFKAEIFVNTQVFRLLNEKVLTSLEVQEGAGKKDKKSAVIIYFCSGGESVWDIARKYSTTVEDIMLENDLSADYLENKRMLLIPVK